MKKIDAVIIATVIVLAIVVALGFMTKPTYSSLTNQTVLVQLTDPPQVPVGTESLNITYSSLQLHYTSKGNVSNWVSMNSSGAIDLLSLVNLTKTIASAQVPNASNVDMVRFNVTSATIVVNGTIYNVTLPSKQVTAKLRPTNINSSSSLLIDFTPSIATIYTLNSTIFVMVPSIRAVVVPSINVSASHAHIGATASLNLTMRKHLEIAKPNITITQVVLNQVANRTEISITVADNSNSSVKINHIMLFGNESVKINGNFSSYRAGISVREKPEVSAGFSVNSTSINLNGSTGVGSSTSTQNTSLTTAIQNGSDLSEGMTGNIYHEKAEISSMLNGTFNASTFPKMFENVSYKARGKAIISEFFNSSVSNISTGNLSEAENEIKNLRNKFREIESEITSNSSVNASVKAEIEQNISKAINNIDLTRIKIEQEHFHVLNFLVSSNATLTLPYLQEMSEFNGTGYTINAGQSATFTFNSSVSFANGHVILSLIPGNAYKVVVIGEEGARASINTTAS